MATRTLLNAVRAELHTAAAVAPSVDVDSVRFATVTTFAGPAFPITLNAGRIGAATSPAGTRLEYSAEVPLLPAAGIHMLLGAIALTGLLAASGLVLWAAPGVALLGGVLRLCVRHSAGMWLEEICSKAEHRAQRTVE